MDELVLLIMLLSLQALGLLTFIYALATWLKVGRIERKVKSLIKIVYSVKYPPRETEEEVT